MLLNFTYSVSLALPAFLFYLRYTHDSRIQQSEHESYNLAQILESYLSGYIASSCARSLAIHISEHYIFHSKCKQQIIVQCYCLGAALRLIGQLDCKLWIRARDKESQLRWKRYLFSLNRLDIWPFCARRQTVDDRLLDDR